MVRMELPRSQVITSTSPRSWFSVMVARAVGPLRPSSAESLQVLQSALRPLVVLLPPLLVQVPLCLLLLPLILLVEISLLEVVLGQISSRETSSEACHWLPRRAQEQAADLEEEGSRR